jgi:histidinol-phosphate aminotransferase
MNLDTALGLINQNIRDLKPYHLEREECAVKLNQNENPFDWPLDIKEEIARFCVDRAWNRYPPFVPEELRDALAGYCGAAKGSVIVGNGSNEMLLVLLLSLANRSSSVVFCQPTFTLYRLLTSGIGAAPSVVPLTAALGYDVSKIRETVAAKPGSLLILCSPNNPTGGALSENDLRNILKVHTGFMVLDQAYVEFGGFDAMPLLKEFPNLIITRTFSKAFSAAGLRVGYLAGAPAVVGELNKIKLPYNINFFSEHVARVMLRNRARLKEGLAVIATEREMLFTFLRALPFDAVYPSEANFILVRCAGKQALFDSLKKDGILVRDVSSYPMLENCLRISVGSARENNALKKALTSFFSGAKKGNGAVQKS